MRPPTGQDGGADRQASTKGAHVTICCSRGDRACCTLNVPSAGRESHHGHRQACCCSLLLRQLPADVWTHLHACRHTRQRGWAESLWIDINSSISAQSGGCMRHSSLRLARRADSSSAGLLLRLPQRSSPLPHTHHEQLVVRVMSLILLARSMQGAAACAACRRPNAGRCLPSRPCATGRWLQSTVCPEHFLVVSRGDARWDHMPLRARGAVAGLLQETPSLHLGGKLSVCRQGSLLQLGFGSRLMAVTIAHHKQLK
jgi:hypothetical protein